jgi:2-dehydropantoate 2-reductase
MRIVIFGAGAVGSVLGARLHQSGADVVLVARPAHVDAISVNGLALRVGQTVEQVPVRAVASVSQLTPQADDVVLITAKTQDVAWIHQEVLKWNPAAAIVCGTNGVEHERMALRLFDRVYAMVIQLPSTFETPGSVTALCAPTNAIVDLGRYPQGVDDLAEELAAKMAAAPHVSCVVDADVMIKKFGKIIVNIGNAAEAAIGLAGRGHPAVAAAQQEAKRVYEAAGIQWQVTPEAERLKYEERVSTMQFSFPPDTTFLGGSTWQSLAKGSPSVETDFFNGEIVLLGRLHGVPTPHNLFLQQLAQCLLASGAQPASMSADDLEQQWKRLQWNRTADKNF